MYQVAGLSKQAVSQHRQRQLLLDNRLEELIAEAQALRRVHPGCGIEKMYYLLKPSFLGRDRFIEVMMQAGFRLTKKSNGRRTTYPGKRLYPNLIKGMKISKPGQLWQSDITYIASADQFFYAVFIIDVYTKVIVGHQLSQTMRATANISALNKAVKAYRAPDIHHSDRGSQYSSLQYLRLLELHGSKVSMGLKAQDNAYAERVNRTIKEEYLQQLKIKTFDYLKRKLDEAVNHYNNCRPHNHLGRQTPIDFMQKFYNEPGLEKPVLIIFNDQ